MKIDVNEFVKESLKIKGTIDVKKSTAENLKLLEKSGVQINLLLAGILDGLNFKEMLEEVNPEDIESESEKQSDDELEKSDEKSVHDNAGVN